MTPVSETSGRGEPITVGLDIGTTSVKAVAVDATGQVMARARVPHRLTTTPPGAFEHDVSAAWRDGPLRALDQVVGGLSGARNGDVPSGGAGGGGARPEVAGVCVAAMGPSLAAVAIAGAALGPGLLYGDGRGEHEVVDPAMPGDGGELLAFLGWLAEHYPRAAGYWPAQAVANHALCGEGVIDHYTALTAYPLFDLTSWDAAITSRAGTTLDRLPRIVPQLEAGGRVRPGLPGEGAVLAGGTVDGYAEQLVSGANEPGDVLVICGTTLITWAVTEAWCTAPGTWSIPHHFSSRFPGRCLIGGPSNAGGLFQDHVARLVGGIRPERRGGKDRRDRGGTDDDTDELGIDPAEVPVWLPYVRGERTPLHRRDLCAALFDVRLHHGPDAVIRAAHEAAGFVVRHHVELAETGGLVPRRVVATGGGTRSPGLMQALADVTGLPVDVAESPEGAARGAAYLARCAAGLADGIEGADAWAKTGHRVEPRDAWRERCDERYRRFRDLTDAALGERRPPSCDIG